MLFPKENIIMIVYGGQIPPPPRSGRHRVSILSPKAPTCCGWGHEGLRV
jgi:hypothetical protein